MAPLLLQFRHFLPLNANSGENPRIDETSIHINQGMYVHLQTVIVLTTLGGT